MSNKSIVALIAEAKAFMKEDKYHEAMAIYTKAFMLNPHDKDIINNIQFLWQRIEDGNYDFVPDNAEEYLMRGISRLYKQEISAALEDYNKAIELDTKLDYAYKCRGFLFYSIGKYELANKDFIEATKINKNCGEYWDDAASNLVAMGNIYQAHLCHETAVNVSPDDARLWYNYGVFFANYLKNAKEALNKFEKAIEIWPKYEDAIVNRDAILQYLKQKDISSEQNRS